jgi:hypothetical protein
MRRAVNCLIAAALTGTMLVACAGPKLMSSRAGSVYRIDQGVPKHERVDILMRPLLSQTVGGVPVDVVFAGRLANELRHARLYQDVTIMSPVSYFVEPSGRGVLPPRALLVEATVDLIFVPEWAWRMHPLTWGKSARARVRVSGTLSVAGAENNLIPFSLQRAAKGGFLGIGGFSTGGEETMIAQLLEWIAEDFAAMIRKGDRRQVGD